MKKKYPQNELFAFSFLGKFGTDSSRNLNNSKLNFNN